ncbi:hypothetical protein EPO04_04110 [Patescibacteria group bacterium]|nr:MAG: hypothetical protein EPO04_04110 [Patescibacteria group bacterium]
MNFKRAFTFGVGVFLLSVILYHPEATSSWLATANYIGGLPLPLIAYTNLAEPVVKSAVIISAINLIISLFDLVVITGAIYLVFRLIRIVRH